MANLKVLTENSTLASLVDVASTAPADGQSLVYSTAAALWVPSAGAGMAAHEVTGTYHTVTGLTTGHVLTAQSTNTIAWAAPTAMSAHEVTGTYHTATGLTTGHVLTAQGTNTFAWAAPAASIAAHEVTGTYHTVTGLTTGYILTAQSTNSIAWSAPPSETTVTLAGRAFPGQSSAEIGTWPAGHAYFNKIMRRYETTAALLGGAALTGAGAGSTTATYGNEVDHHVHTSLTTATTANAAASIRCATPEFDMADYGAGWFFTVRFAVRSIGTAWKTDTRVFMGFNASSSAMAGGTDPSGLVNIVGLGKDSADSVFYFMHNDGSGTATKTTAVLSNDPTKEVWYDFHMWMPPDGASVGWQLNRTSTRATIASGTASSNLPATGALYAPHVFIGNGSGTTATRLDTAFMHIEAYH